MKICLINPLSTFNPYINLGLLMVAAAIEKSGHKVEIIDFNLLATRKEIETGESFFNIAEEMIISKSAEVLGFTAMTNSYPVVLKIAERCKKKNPELIIIFGGAQPTITDIETLENFPFVDIIVRGEAEQTIAELIEKISEKKSLKNVRGITYRENGAIIKNEDRELIENIDILPDPAFHLLPIEEYFKKRQLLPIEGGRGCSFNCTYCSSQAIWKRRVRMMSPDRIVKKMRNGLRGLSIKNSLLLMIIL